MPQLVMDFPEVKFSPNTLRKARDAYLERLGYEAKTNLLVSATLNQAETWTYDNEDEFFNDYVREVQFASYRHMVTGVAAADLMVNFFRGNGTQFYRPYSQVTIRLPERAQVLAVLNVFEGAAASERVYKAPPAQPVIFIGHGHSTDWKDLRDHLRDQQKFEVEAFEGSPREGYPAIHVIVGMADRSTIALLVHTAEDEMIDGRVLARSNVIHETGFFQGRLGPHHAILLREDGCGEYSNLAGVQEIRYATGHIDATFGRVVALVRRMISEAEQEG